MQKHSSRISTGVPGLDNILGGGLLSRKAYLLYGGPGSGKSLMGYHFLEEGRRNNEECLLISLGETAESIKNNAADVSIDMDGISILDLTPEQNVYKNAESYDFLAASEIDTPALVKAITTKVDELKPSRVLLDSISMMKLLFNGTYQYRKIGLAFIKYIRQSGATLLIISETYFENDNIESFWVDGVLNLSFENMRRTVETKKLRGSSFRPGLHSFSIENTGIQVHPRLQPNNYERTFKKGVQSFNIAELDSLTHGGLEIGTTTMITGPTGIGKTSLGIQFIKAAATRNQRSVLYTFEESPDTIIQRSKGINVPIDNMHGDGNLHIESIEPMSYSPDEFANKVRHEVEENDTRVIMLDSINAYTFSVLNDNPLQRLHSLALYLQNMGVTLILVNEIKSITGDFISNNLNASYLADNIIYLRYVEINGQLKKSIGVLKKRLSGFEPTIRELHITSQGITLGPALEHLQGILTASPNYNNATLKQQDPS